MIKYIIYDTETISDNLDTDDINIHDHKPFMVSYIVADEKCNTKTEGLFVAGDCRTKEIRQVATAVGDGATAATNACKYLNSLEV